MFIRLCECVCDMVFNSVLNAMNVSQEKSWLSNVTLVNLSVCTLYVSSGASMPVICMQISFGAVKKIKWMNIFRKFHSHPRKKSKQMNTFDGWQLTIIPQYKQFDFGGGKCIAFSLSFSFIFGGLFHIHSV